MPTRCHQVLAWWDITRNSRSAMGKKRTAEKSPKTEGQDPKEVRTPKPEIQMAVTHWTLDIPDPPASCDSFSEFRLLSRKNRSNSLKSLGHSAFHRICFPVSGCSNSNTSACSAWREYSMCGSFPAR